MWCCDDCSLFDLKVPFLCFCLSLLSAASTVEAHIRVFAIYQIMLGWKTYEYFYETDELPNPKPIQPKKKLVKGGIFGPLFPVGNTFSWVGVDFV